VKRLICRLFGHRWYATVVRLPCRACTDTHSRCERCGEERVTPFFRKTFCHDHSAFLKYCEAVADIPPSPRTNAVITNIRDPKELL
jgi:hypothetical protein